ncbi:hypothetical protein [Haloarcula sp. JP-L23]|uniref:hypothetical protein n=1 Tax=Haloarcula sp. JP-L23 TaxID=2716717 RepID=UPI001D0503A1
MAGPEGEEVFVVYYWDSLDALESFGTDSDHRRAKQRWAEWYDAYKVTVAEVVKAYGSGFGDDADPPASDSTVPFDG